MLALHKEVPYDLIELVMNDFDIILRMDRLHSSYASITCRTYRVKFQFPNELVLEWKDSDLLVKG